MATSPKNPFHSPARPTGTRVAQRACALAGVAARALLEQEDVEDSGVEEVRQRILSWITEIKIADELEPNESEYLHLRLGAPPHQDTINSTWRLEGLGVLAWALCRYEIPAPDQLVDPHLLLPALGFLNVPKASAMILEPALRSPQEIGRMAGRLLGIHWRLRDWSLTKEPRDFLSFSKESWFGSFDISGIALVDNDLALNGAAIKDALPDLVEAARSAALERHQAINWLTGQHKTYSKVDTST
jgi:hypothetical protein